VHALEFTLNINLVKQYLKVMFKKDDICQCLEWRLQRD